MTDVEGKGKVLELKGSGKLTFPQGFFDGLSNMIICMDVCAQSDSVTVFSMGSTVKNKISSYTVSAGADGEIVEELGNGLSAVLGAAYGADGGFRGLIDNVKVYNWTVEEANLANPEEANREAASVVTDAVGSLGKISYDAASKKKIEEARKAYEALNDVQKSLVDISALEEAEKAYARLEKEANEIISISKAVTGSISKQNYTGKL